MWPNPQETADLITFTKEILIGKFHFLWIEVNGYYEKKIVLKSI